MTGTGARHALLIGFCLLVVALMILYAWAFIIPVWEINNFYDALMPVGSGA